MQIDIMHTVKESHKSPLLDRQIACVTEGLTGEYFRYFSKLSQDNALVIANYILSVKSETNMSDHYRMMIIKMLSKLSVFTGNKPFRSMTRGTDVLPFLDTIHKPEGVDPMHKWIGTYNLHNTVFTRFFKWLYSPDIPPSARPKPSVVENIGRLKRREISIYKPTDLWSEEDDKLFLKYCPSKRIKCYHMVSRDTSCRPNEILKLKVKDIVFKTSGNYQYAEVLVNGKTGTRNIPLINSIPYVKDYLDHEHPQPGNLNAPFICGSGKSLGRHVGVQAIYTIYNNYKREYFLKLLENPNVILEDKQKIRELMKKPWLNRSICWLESKLYNAPEISSLFRK
jgi:integrase